MLNTVGLVISTLNDRIFNIKNLLLIDADEIVVVHQITEQQKKDAYNQFYQSIASAKIKIIPLDVKGLSISRNTGLAAGKSDYLLLCDDDAEFVPDVISILKENAGNHPGADILTFQIMTPAGKPYKQYNTVAGRHTRRTAARVSSVEMLIKRTWLTKTGLQFDTNFGLGAKFPTGEEFIFLTDALRKGARAEFIPRYIVIHPIESSGKLFTETLIKSKGALFARTYGWQYIFVNCLFAIKKYQLYRNEFSFCKFLKLINAGSKTFFTL